MEAHEIHEFAHQMKESGEANESLKVISLAISILAVLVAMASVAAHRTHTESVLLQTRAADQWNEYQSESIRLSSLTIAADQLGLQSPLTAAAAAKRDQYERDIRTWTADLAVEQKKAELLDESVEHAESRAARYDLGEALLQIAVVLCSVTLFTRNHAYFLFGLSVAALGVVVACTALFVH